MKSQLFDQANMEQEGEGLFVRQSSKMMKVELSEGPIMALAGSMVAYQGDVQFEHQGAGGVKKFLKQAITGEGLPLMRMQGQGEVFLANRGGDVHLLTLDNESISINGQNVLAYTAGLQTDIQMLRGAGMMSGGLFNTTLTGTGQVAIVTDGPPLVLNVAEAPTFVDPDAAVCWSASLNVTLKASFGMKSLVGRTSGEEMQLAFAGNGFVIVQPSENMRFGGQDQGQQVGNAGGFNVGDLFR